MVGVSLYQQSVKPTRPLLNALTDVKNEPLGLLAIISLMAWGLGYFGQPHILARFKAIRSVAEIPAARRIAVSWVSLTLICAVLVGLVGIVYLEQPLQGADTEKVFILLVDALFHPVDRRFMSGGYISGHYEYGGLAVTGFRGSVDQ